MNQSLWLVLALSVPSVLVAVVLAIVLIKRKAQERSGVERLLAVVKAAEPDYRQALERRFAQDGQVAEAKAIQTADKLVKQRRQYFKQLLASLLERKPDALLKLEPALVQYSEAHLQLLGSLAAAAAPANAMEAAVVASTANTPAGAGGTEAQWRSENDRLRREVGLTLSALNNIFAEYASMFGDEHTRRDMNLEEILNSMQQLAAGQPAESTEPASEAMQENRPLTAAPVADVELAGIDAVTADDAPVAGDPFAETESLVEPAPADVASDKA